MARFLCSFLFIFASFSALFAQWRPAGDKILTFFGENLDTENVLNEYPRPALVRSQWTNLNGMWEYCILRKGEARPSEYDGEILVPFPIESALSGVGKRVGSENELWYRRTFDSARHSRNERVILNFGAVDWDASVYINGVSAGSHTGGYTAFSFDITDLLIKGKNTLEVRVFDPTEDGCQAIGKQRNAPHGIWYTSVTGIWQTVWMEVVPSEHIEGLRILPDIDARTLHVSAEVSPSAVSSDCDLVVTLFDGKTEVASANVAIGQTADLKVDEMKLWSPDTPFLYDLKVSLKKKRKVVDYVESYAAMRKISKVKDENGIYRIALNNEILFNFGTLDQGWWPDGLYTAPSDEALEYDIKMTKKLGFNTIRKHVKVEPARWYYHCDRLGMMVWQDMPCGDYKGSEWNGRKEFIDTDSKVRSQSSADGYVKEWSEIMDMLYNYPCIVMWIPFNESWGQFETEKIAAMTARRDSSRILNIASGGNLFRAGDVVDIHNYPEPAMYFSDSEYINVLGEYGGIGLPVEGHLWHNDATKKNWGYIKLEDSDMVTSRFITYIDILNGLRKKGFAAAIYTQTTDVEGEVNGLMTYDRKVLKVDKNKVKGAVMRLYDEGDDYDIAYKKDNFVKTIGSSKTSLFTLKNDNMTVQLTNYGARIVSIIVPDTEGNLTNVVLGFDNIDDYLNSADSFYGPVVGRYANRIGGGTFCIDGCKYQLTQNEGKNQLHGGFKGFYKKVWNGREFTDSLGNPAVEMTCISPDGDEGYPGTMSVSVLFTLQNNALHISYTATCDRPTICNITSHPYFNLHGSSLKSIKTHYLQVYASYYTPTDSELIPTGKILPVAGTSADFKTPKVIGAGILMDDSIIATGNGGYDMNFVINRISDDDTDIMAVLYEKSTGIMMQISSDQKGLQFYSGQGMADPFSGVVFEPQNFPDAPNHIGFPNAVLRPGEVYHSVSVFSFSTLPVL